MPIEYRLKAVRNEIIEDHQTINNWRQSSRT